MKKLLMTALISLATASLLWSGCGDDNYTSPYKASQGATITGVGNAELSYGGGGASYVYHVMVIDSDGEPLNDMDLWVWVGVYVNAQSNYATDLTIDDFIYEGAPDFNGYDGEWLPHYTTDNHGRVDVILTIPAGFAGTLDLRFDVGSNIAEADLTIVPAGGTCFNGEDDNDNDLIDREDGSCSTYTNSET